MAYKEVVGGAAVQWTELNQVFEGLFLGTEEGKFGLDFLFKVGEEEHIIFGSAALRSKMKEVPEGSKVRITYLGEKKSADGRLYRDFKVEYEVI